MITRFRVQGFKSLLDAEIELGAVNVFIGANGSGKSNLLEAFGVLSATIHGEVEPETLRYRGVRMGGPKSYKSSIKSLPPREIDLGVESRKTRYQVKYENPTTLGKSRWKILSERLSEDGSLIMGRLYEDVSLGYRVAGDYTFKVAEDQSAALFGLRVQSENVLYIESALAMLKDLEGYAIFTPTTPVLRGLADDIARLPLGLGGSGLPQAIESMIDRAAETLGPFDLEDVWTLIDWAEGLATGPVRADHSSLMLRTGSKVIEFVDRAMRGEERNVSLYEASEGALYVLFLLALVGHPDSPKLFAVDNFDQALHPRLARELTRLVTQQIVNAGDRQMLATTHNPLVLDGLDLLDDRIRLFAVDRDVNGVTQVKRVEVTPELMGQAEQGMSLSRLWVMGRLGGVPQSL